MSKLTELDQAEAELARMLRVGPPTLLWDYSLRMGVKLDTDGRKTLFRYPSVPPHPLARESVEPVSDDEFRRFYKLMLEHFK